MANFIYNDEFGTTYVKEDNFFKFITRAKQLVLDQRHALRTGDKRRIEDCKKRERALLDWVTQYEAYRQHYIPYINRITSMTGNE